MPLNYTTVKETTEIVLNLHRILELNILSADEQVAAQKLMEAARRELANMGRAAHGH